jgi:hypothetical protein
MDFKPIRNKLRKYSYESLVEEILTLLHFYENQASPVPYWHPLLLLRWTMEFAGETRPSKTADQRVIALLLKDLEELELAHQTFNLTTNGRKINKTFIILSFQQMIYQEHSWWDSFARQIILYEEIKADYDIDGGFENLTGINIRDFLTMLWVYWMIYCNQDLTKLKTDDGTLVDIAAILTSKLGIYKVTSFLALLSVMRENINQVISEDNRLVKNYDLQIFETSVFTRKPFLVFNDQPRIIYKSLLNTTANYFLYDYLKNKDDRFTTEFGARMERYIAESLKYIYEKVETEAGLRRKFGRTAQIVDFILEDRVLVEVKAIELKPHIGVNPTDEKLGQEFKKNVVKAYAEQMLSIAEKLKNEKDLFGVIITYKNLHLGNSKDVWEQFLREETEKIRSADEINLLPIENLFFIDLHTWDKLMEILQRKTLSLVDILEKIKATDSNPATKKHTFNMHLDEYHIGHFTLPYLMQAKKKLDQFFHNIN